MNLVFGQGLILSYAYNHQEAERSFREASKLDPNCAICNWGVALARDLYKEFYNEAAFLAWKELQKAQELSKKASKK